MSSRSRTIRPLVALLKWLTTDRFSTPFTICDCSTRTLAVRSATSPAGFHAPVYADDRRSSTSPLPAASGMTEAMGARQYAFSAPRPGSFTPIEQRYEGIRSPMRTAPHSPEKTRRDFPARRRAAGSREARSRASYSTPV